MITPDWAWGGADGHGVRVGVIDSGIDPTHPLVDGRVTGWAEFSEETDGRISERFTPHTDAFGHGTACAGIIRALAPEAELVSIKVLGARLSGKGGAFIAGLRWAIAQRLDVVNLSLGSGKRDLMPLFHELVDQAYFQGMVLVTAANNLPAVSYPSLFAGVLSVACHAGQDPYEFYANPAPPVEFGAPGINLDVAWLEGGQLRVTGNSFAAPHVAGLVARILSKHPGLTPFQVKTILRATARNATPGPPLSPPQRDQR